VYEPLTAFDRERQLYWRRYVKDGRAVAPLDGPGRQRTQVLEALGAGWSRLPELPDEAYVLETDETLLICPWNLRFRVAEAVEEITRWLEEFHPRSLVELDYGGLVSLLPDDALQDDDSPGLVAAGLAGLSHSDADTASAIYEQLVARWRAVQLLERCN
jgi:hypothetical protein